MVPGFFHETACGVKYPCREGADYRGRLLGDDVRRRAPYGQADVALPVGVRRVVLVLVVRQWFQPDRGCPTWPGTADHSSMRTRQGLSARC